MIPFRLLFPTILASLSLIACKPTERTAPEAQKHSQTNHDPSGATDIVAASPEKSLLRISSITQEYNLLRPWEKNNPEERSRMGVYLGNNLVLTTADIAANATYVEMELPDGSRTAPARVVHYDTAYNLALLTLSHEEDHSIFRQSEALEPGAPLQKGDTAEFWGLASGLTPVRLPVAVEGSEWDTIPLLNVKSEQALPSSNGAGHPLVRNGKMVALAHRYDTKTQTLSCINAELISRFLEDAKREHPGTENVPQPGMETTPIHDPVFRRYLRMPEQQGGLYISRISPTGAAAQAGLKEGDVITAIEERKLDNQGRLQHPPYGLIDARALISAYKPMGDTLKLTINRSGEQKNIELPLNRDAADKGLLIQQRPGTAPTYVMWGGLLFQPITHSYLNQIRRRSNGALPFVPILRLLEEEEELTRQGVTEPVAITMIIPTPATLSYDNLHLSLVKKINGRPVHNLKELAEFLDEPTEDGVVSIEINQAPYVIYLDRQTSEQTNDALLRRTLPSLRSLPKE